MTSEMHHTIDVDPTRFALFQRDFVISEPIINDPKARSIRLHDSITLRHPKGLAQIDGIVIGLSEFDCFREMFRFIDPAQFGYSPRISIEEAVADLQNRYGSAPEDLHGVVALHIDFSLE